MIGSHRKEVVPSDASLNRCVDVVNECSKKIGHICFLANTPYHHVSVANDASNYDEQYGFFYQENNAREGGARASSAGLSLSRGSTYSITSHGITLKEQKRIFAIELSKLMIEPVMTYINLRKTSEYYDKDENYDLYWALGCMHRWLEEDASNETEDQKFLETIDNRTEEKIMRDNRWKKDGDYMVKLLVAEHDVPKYGYPQLLELVGRVGLLSKEYFPFTSHSEDAQKDFFERPITGRDEDSYHADNLMIRQNPDLFYTRRIMKLLTPPRISVVEEFEDNLIKNSRSVNSSDNDFKEYPNVKELPVKVIREEQAYVLELFRTWARALATYFLHCELMLREEISNKLEKERIKKDEHEFEVQQLRKLNELRLEQLIREETERKYHEIEEDKCRSLLKDEEENLRRQKEADKDERQKQKYSDDITAKSECKENDFKAFIEKQTRDRVVSEYEELEKRKAIDDEEKHERGLLIEDISRVLDTDEKNRAKLEHERTLYIMAQERSEQRKLFEILDEETDKRDSVSYSERKSRVKMVREIEECMAEEIERNHPKVRRGSKVRDLKFNEDDDSQNNVEALQQKQTREWMDVEEKKQEQLERSTQDLGDGIMSQERMLQAAAVQHRKMIDDELRRQKEEEEEVRQITSQHVLELEKEKHERDMSIMTNIIDLENREEEYIRRIIDNDELAERKHIYQLFAMDFYEIEESQVADEVDRRRAQRQQMILIKSERGLDEEQEATENDAEDIESPKVLPNVRFRESDCLGRLREKQMRESKHGVHLEHLEEMFLLERGAVEYGAAAVGCDEEIEEVGEMVSREILETEEDQEFNKLLHSQILEVKEATDQRLQDEAEKQLRAEDEIAQEDEILLRLRERQMRESKHRAQLEEMFSLERRAVEYGAAAVGCDDEIEEVGEMVSREILETEEDQEFNKLIHSQIQEAIEVKEATAQRLQDEAEKQLRAKDDLGQMYLFVTTREDAKRTLSDCDEWEKYARWGIANEEWEEFLIILSENAYKVFLKTGSNNISLEEEIHQQHLEYFGYEESFRNMILSEYDDFIKQITDEFKGHQLAPLSLRLEGSRTAQLQYLKGINSGAIRSDEYQQLQGEMEALRRENRYLCSVVNDVSTNHTRLHQHVLEIDDDVNYQLSAINEALAPPDNRVIVEERMLDADSSDVTCVTHINGQRFICDRLLSCGPPESGNSNGVRESRETDNLHLIDNISAINGEVQSPKCDPRNIQEVDGSDSAMSGSNRSKNRVNLRHRLYMERAMLILDGDDNQRSNRGSQRRHGSQCDVSSPKLKMDGYSYEDIHGSVPMYTGRPSSCIVRSSPSQSQDMQIRDIQYRDIQANRHSIRLIDEHRKETEQRLKLERILCNIMTSRNSLNGRSLFHNDLNVNRDQHVHTVSPDNYRPYENRGIDTSHTVEDPLVLFSGTYLPWINKEKIDIAKDDHLKRIQMELFGHRTVTDSGGTAGHTTATDAEIREALDRQKYEMNVVAMLIREIRERSLGTFRRKSINNSSPLVSPERQEASHYQSYMAETDDISFLPTPCIKLDLSIMAPWITDIYFEMILQGLLDSAEAPKLYLADDSVNVSSTLQVIDITRCRYVNSETNLTKLALLVELCPMLQHVMYDKLRFRRSIEEGSLKSNSNLYNEGNNDEDILNTDDKRGNVFTEKGNESDSILMAIAELDNKLALKSSEMRSRNIQCTAMTEQSRVSRSRPMSAMLRRRRSDGTAIL